MNRNWLGCLKQNSWQMVGNNILSALISVKIFIFSTLNCHSLIIWFWLIRQFYFLFMFLMFLQAFGRKWSKTRWFRLKKRRWKNWSSLVLRSIAGYLRSSARLIAVPEDTASSRPRAIERMLEEGSIADLRSIAHSLRSSAPVRRRLIKWWLDWHSFHIRVFQLPIVIGLKTLWNS